MEPPPAVVTLRPTAPVHQAPPPVVNSQPATNSFRGKHLEKISGTYAKITNLIKKQIIKEA